MAMLKELFTRYKNKMVWVVVFSVLAITLFSHWLHTKREYRASGSVMGTTWHIVYSTTRISSQQQKAVEKSASAALHRVDHQMSTYKKTSELMRLNAWPVNRPFPASRDLVTVLGTSLDISKLSEGAYDVTVGSLVNLWGFGPSRDSGGRTRENSMALPSEKDISRAKKVTGYQYIELDSQKMSIKKTKDIFIDLSSIAKGYGVDQAALTLERQGIHNYLVEVGGEVHASGYRADGKPWQVAIISPEKVAGQPDRTIGLHDVAMATSGDYLNYYRVNHVRYSHEINPETGWPEKNDIASVSVIAKNTMLADAYATMFMILPAKKGRELATTHKLAVYMIYRHNDKKEGKNFTTFTSPMYKAYLESKGKGDM